MASANLSWHRATKSALTVGPCALIERLSDLGFEMGDAAEGAEGCEGGEKTGGGTAADPGGTDGG